MAMTGAQMTLLILTADNLRVLMRGHVNDGIHNEDIIDLISAVMDVENEAHASKQVEVAKAQCAPATFIVHFINGPDNFRSTANYYDVTIEDAQKDFYRYYTEAYSVVWYAPIAPNGNNIPTNNAVDC